MSTISTALRNFKEPTKDQLTHIFFSIPPDDSTPKEQRGSSDAVAEKMDINAVLSLGVQDVEDSYVGLELNVMDNDNDDGDNE